MSYETIAYTVEGQVATIALNRPEKGNGYTEEMGAELVLAFDAADHDPDVRVVVLAGRGANFCVGADLSGGTFSSGELLPPDWKEPAGIVSTRIFAMNKPVIAALRGAAVGAGSTIILACDYRLAQVGTRIGYVFSRRGIHPEGTSAWFLPRIVGLGTALDWMISGRLIGADEALQAGLVHSVHEDVDAAAAALAADLTATTAPVSTAVIRRLLFHALAVPTPHDIQPIDSRLIAESINSVDAIEGVMSFFERHPPAFTGRVPDDLPAWLPWLHRRTPITEDLHA
jgi:enoyl-CoA hydratase/carnithine racemase